MHPKQPSYEHWVTLGQIVAQIGFCSSSFFCYILIFLTVFGVERRYGSYTYLLVLLPTVGIFFATFEILLYPHVHSYNAGCVYLSTRRLFNTDADVIIWAMSFYSGLYASTISILAVQFVYRYWAVFDQGKLWYFKSWRFLLSISYISFFGCQCAIGIYFFTQPDDYAFEYMSAEIEEKYGIQLREVPALFLIAYDANGSIRWFNMCGTIAMSFVIAVQYTVIIYCGFFMWQKMEERIQVLSQSLRTLHKQFFHTLILQISGPTIFLFLPVTFILCIPFFNVEVNLPTGVFMCAFALYPAMDALIIMYIVTDYRHAAKRMLKESVLCIHKINVIILKRNPPPRVSDGSRANFNQVT